MTYNIILLLFTISSILKCQFLNHTQPLYKITISSICLALLRYIIHVLVLAPAIFIFHSTCHTRWCTTPPNEGEALHCHVVFHHCCCSSVVAPALCHWKRYMHHRVSQWSFFQQYWNGLLMGCHWAVSLCVLWFHWKLENSGARDVSAARTLSYTVTVASLLLNTHGAKNHGVLLPSAGSSLRTMTPTHDVNSTLSAFTLRFMLFD